MLTACNAIRDQFTTMLSLVSGTKLINSTIFCCNEQCFTITSPVFHQCFNSVSEVVHQCFTSISQVFHQCFTSVLQVFHQCFTSVLPVFHKCFSSVVRAARIWLGFEPDRTSQAVSGSARQLFRCQANCSARLLTGF